MAITAAGVGSGLDIENIVSQLMELEREPLVAVQRRVTDTKAEISAFGTLKSALSTFQSAMGDLGTLDAFRKFSGESSDEDVLKASADGTAAAGIYDVEVTRLAQNFKQGSKEFAEGNTVGGTSGDSLTLTVDGEALTVDLSTAQTLEQVRDAINSSADNPGVIATILNTGDGNQRMILTAEEAGYDKRYTVTYGGTLGSSTFDFETLNKNPSDQTMTDLTQLDAAFSIDGYSLTASSNQVTSAIDGLTLELEGVGSADLVLERDSAAIQESAQQFVDAYNAVLDAVDTLEAQGVSSDSLLRTITQSMRDLLNTPPVDLNSSYNALAQVGIKTNANTGRMEFTAEEFTTALNTDFNGVAQLFANDDQGYAYRFEALMDTFLDIDGLLDTRVDVLNDRVDSLEDRELQFERRLDLKEASLRSQFAALDSLVGSLQSTSSFLLSNFGI